MTDKDTSALIETFKVTNEELLRQVALLTEQVEHLTNNLNFPHQKNYEALKTQ